MAVHLSDHYTDPTYTACAAPALNAAMAASKVVIIDDLPDGKFYPLYVPATAAQNFQKIIGYGKGASKLRAMTADRRMIDINPGLNGVEVRRVHMTRAVPALPGGEAIRTLGGQSNCIIEDCYIEDQWNGMVLLSGDNCHVHRNTVIGSYSHAVLGTNSTFAWDWNFIDNTISKGDADGILFVWSNVPGAPAVCPIGAMVGNRIFSLSGYGIRVLGSPIVRASKVSVLGGFIGSTGNSAVHLDTYEGYHKVLGVEVEQVGVDMTGRSWSTPASMLGDGIEVTANNGKVQVDGGRIQTIARNGVSSRGDLLMIGTGILNCGVAGIPGYRNGVAAYGGKAKIIGVSAGNTPGGSSQQFGLWKQVAADILHEACDFRDNATAEIFAVS